MNDQLRKLKSWESERQPELREFKKDISTSLRDVVAFAIALSLGSHFRPGVIPIELASIVLSLGTIVIFLSFLLLVLSWVIERYYYEVQP